MDVHVNKNSDGDRKIGTAYCTPSDTIGKSHRVPLLFAEEHAMLLKCRSLHVQRGRKGIGEVQCCARATLKHRKYSSVKTVMNLLFLYFHILDVQPSFSAVHRFTFGIRPLNSEKLGHIERLY